MNKITLETLQAALQQRLAQIRPDLQQLRQDADDAEAINALFAPKKD